MKATSNQSLQRSSLSSQVSCSFAGPVLQLVFVNHVDLHTGDYLAEVSFTCLNHGSEQRWKYLSVASVNNQSLESPWANAQRWKQDMQANANKNFKTSKECKHDTQNCTVQQPLNTTWILWLRQVLLTEKEWSIIGSNTCSIFLGKKVRPYLDTLTSPQLLVQIHVVSFLVKKYARI